MPQVADNHYSMMLYFSHLLFFFKDELDSTAEVWNSHIIRPSTNQNVPHGRPDIMFSIPELYSVQNYICAVNEGEVQICSEDTLQRSGYSCDEDIYDTCIDLMAQHGLNFGGDVYKKIDLYLELRRLIQNIVD